MSSFIISMFLINMSMCKKIFKKCTNFIFYPSFIQSSHTFILRINHRKFDRKFGRRTMTNTNYTSRLNRPPHPTPQKRIKENLMNKLKMIRSEILSTHYCIHVKVIIKLHKLAIKFCQIINVSMSYC